MRKCIVLLLVLFCLSTLVSCKEGGGQSSEEFTITVNHDGVTQPYRYYKQASVRQFLDEIGITLGDLDEVNPSLSTQLRDGLNITITRVVEDTECELEPVPFGTDRIPTQLLAVGATDIGATGEPGEVQVCYLITKRDGIVVSRNENSRVITKQPRNEVLYYGSEASSFIAIEGTLAYITGGQAWVIEGITTAARPITVDGYLDQRVFDLSPDGHQLLYTRRTADTTDSDFSNELWVVLDTASQAQDGVQLLPSDVRYAQWVPGEESDRLSYSTADPIDAGWNAYNDLYLMQIDSETGAPIGAPENIVPQNSTGIYAYWGRRFVWSPDGGQVAWANGESVGLVDLETGAFNSLLTFTNYAPALSAGWVWVPQLSWAPDGKLITTVHGIPYGTEDPERSVIFDMAVLDTTNAIQVNPFMSQSGIWTCPTYSPMVNGPDGNPSYSVAFFKSREPLNSVGAQYDLWVADSDGSNARLLFPGPNREGFRPDPEDGIAWSPTARKLAFIYQDNLWIYDFETDLAHQITTDGQVSRPRWAGN